MKKISKLFWLAIVFAGCCLLVGVLEVTDLHPQFSVGNFHSIWVGVRKMDLQSGTAIIPLQNGRTEIDKDYDLGPLKVTIVHDS